jgi:hypothetical protein
VSKITTDQYFRIKELTLHPDRKFTPEDIELLPGLHDCPEWDGPIFSGMSEWESCGCAIKAKEL